MLETGVPLMTVVQILGHRNAEMISRVYAHIGTKWKREGLNTLSPLAEKCSKGGLELNNTLPDDFWGNINEMENACLIWSGAYSASGKVPTVFINGTTMVSANRVLWELLTGETLPPNVRLIRNCGNPLCINPEHMTKSFTKDARQNDS
jgi:hypothetical protein